MPKSSRKKSPSDTSSANSKTMKDTAQPDPQAVLRDALENLRKAYRHLWHDMKRFGVTQKMLAKKMHELSIELDIDRHPLVRSAQTFSDLAQEFLNAFFFEQQRLLMQFGVEVPIDDVSTEIDRIAATQATLPLKSWRLVFEVYDLRTETNPRLHTAIAESLIGYNRVVSASISRSQRALHSFSQKRAAEQPARIEELLKCLDKVREELKNLK